MVTMVIHQTENPCPIGEQAARHKNLHKPKSLMETRLSQRWGSFRGRPLSSPSLSQGAAVRRLQRFARSRFTRTAAAFAGVPAARRKTKARIYTQGLNPYTRKMNTFLPRVHRRVTMLPEVMTISGTGATDAGRSTFNMTGVRPDATLYTNMSQSGTAAISDLQAFRDIFRYYRLEKIRVFFKTINSEFTDATQYPTLYTRYCYDANAALPGSADYFNELTNTNRHTFTNESPEFVTTIYPKIQTPKYALSGLTSDGFAYSPASPGWIDLTGTATGSQVDGADCQHYGLDWFITNIPAGQAINVSVEFTMAFKTQA